MIYHPGPLGHRVDRKRSEEAVLGLGLVTLDLYPPNPNPNPNLEQLQGTFNRLQRVKGSTRHKIYF